MESRLAILATAQVILLAAAGVAAADTKKLLAKQLFELGIQEYKDKQYDAAVSSMSKSYSLDPQPDALYALAQAERLVGDCQLASIHYQKLLEITKDEATLKTVKTSLALCLQLETGEVLKVDAVLDPKATAQRDAPTIQIRTVYRTERHSDRLAIAMFAAGGVALGGSVTTYLLARSTRSDANRAQSLTEFNTLFDRASRLRWASYGAAGLGVALVGFATYRVIRGGGNETQVPQVAIVPVTGGSMISWASEW